MTDKQQRSLSALFEQRKHQHRLPDSVRANVQRANGKTKKRIWTTALPASMASLLVVIVIWPVQEGDVLETMSLQRSSDYLEPLASAPVEILEEEMADEMADEMVMADDAPSAEFSGAIMAEEAPSLMAEADEIVRAEAVASPTAKTLAKPAPKKRSSAEEGNILDAQSTVSSENQEKEFAQLTPEDFAEPQALFIETIEPNIGTNCEGRIFRLPANLELISQQWMLIQWNESGGWTLDSLSEYPCTE